jgi:hypothetical protein
VFFGRKTKQKKKIGFHFFFFSLYSSEICQLDATKPGNTHAK